MSKQWSSRLSNEVVEYISVDAPELWESLPTDAINLKNGILRVTDRELLPHSPDHLSSIQLPVKYDADAECPAIIKFVRQIFPKDAVELAFETVAWLMLLHAHIQKAMLILGEGGEGKSTWLNLIMTFLGKSNVSTMPLKKLESDRFAVARLVGKLANICPDLPSRDLEGTSVFKSIIGGDIITGECKFKESFDFLPSARRRSHVWISHWCGTSCRRR